MVEGVEGLDPELQTGAIPDLEILPHVEIRRPRPRPHEAVAPRVAEGEFRRGAVCLGVVPARGAGIGNIGIAGQVGPKLSERAGVRRVEADSGRKRKAGGDRRDPANLPTAEDPVDHAALVEETAPHAERQIPREARDGAIALVVIGRAALAADVVAVWRPRRSATDLWLVVVRLAIRECSEQPDALAPPLVEFELEGVVGRAARVGDRPEVAVLRVGPPLLRVARAGLWLVVVAQDLQVGSLGPDVRDLEERVPADVALYADVPLLVVGTLEAQIRGENSRERSRGRIQRREPLAHVGRGRDTELARLRQREEEG